MSIENHDKPDIINVTFQVARKVMFMPTFNVIYLHTHDTGRSIQPYDPGISTPALMELSREGLCFRNAYCVGPTCSPSRSGLLTGTYPHENGMLGLAHRGFALKDYGWHLARFLGGHGYETALFGMQHEAAAAETIGYDRCFADPRREGADRWLWDERNADHVIDFLREKHERPFFLSYGQEMTHKPYPDPSLDPDYVKVPACLPDTPEVRRDWAGFLEAADLADRQIGRVLEALKETDLWDSTIVLYTTDHGVALPHMKCTLRDDGVGVAMILSVPGYRAKRVSDVLVSQLDVFPTLCELLGLSPPARLRGRSLLPLLEGKTEEIHRAVFAEINFHAARDPQRMVRTRQYKYIRRYGAVEHPIPCNIDAGESKEQLVRAGLLQWRLPREELFDLMLDPGEGRNLADEEAYADVLEEMKALLRTHMEDTDDPLICGELPDVPGAVINRTDCYDAEMTAPEYLEQGG